MAAASTGKQIFSDINITPLTDIFLVLLIIMMVVAPMMQTVRPDIKPPSIQSGGPVKQSKLTVEVTADGQYFVNSQATPADGLKAAFELAAKDLTEKNVIIRADQKTRSGAVLTVLEAARDAQYEKVTVAGEPLSGSRQSDLTSGTPSEEAIQ